MTMTMTRGSHRERDGTPVPAIQPGPGDRIAGHTTRQPRSAPVMTVGATPAPCAVGAEIAADIRSDAWRTPPAAAAALGMSLGQVMALIEAGLLVPEACPGPETEGAGRARTYRRECSL